MFFDIFAEKIGEKISVFAQNKAKLCKNWILKLFLEKNAIFRRKLASVAENCDHNIDPRLGEFSPIGWLFSLVIFIEN
jgi:hypothetical protein